jgi:FAD/FMN-containing dehydrogenase
VAPPTTIVGDLRAVVGAEHVLVDGDQRSGYETDWTGRYTGRATAVVRPRTTAEVAGVLSACARIGAAVIPQGGNTGLVGGGVPRHDGPDTRPVVVLSTRRLVGVSDVDPAAMQLTAGAGVTIGEWRDAARAVGLDTPVDFAARDSATVGGAIATDAGGSRVVRFGTMRRQVVGVEAVLADGRVVGSLSGLPKETVGLHWPSVLTGTEGTLGVVTAARLRLVPRFEHVITAMLCVDSVGEAAELAGRLRRSVASLDSVEMMQPEALDLVAEHLGVAPPVMPSPHGTVLVVECADHSDPTAGLVAALGQFADRAVVAVDPSRRMDLLAFRDRLTEAIATTATRIGPPVFKLDVAVPVGALADLLDVARSAAAADGCRLIAFGHLAEGNLHLNHLNAQRPDAIADTVLAAVARLGGTISAEHGIGVAKTSWLHLVRSADDLAAQVQVKRALDPGGILNPGVLVAPPAHARSGRDPDRDHARDQVP